MNYHLVYSRNDYYVIKTIAIYASSKYYNREDIIVFIYHEKLRKHKELSASSNMKFR